MFKNYFESISGIDIYPIFSLILFLGFFLFVIAWTFKADKSYLKEMEQLPVNKSGDHE